MIINLEEMNINFDLENETPFFQASNENRVRFDVEHVNKKQLSNIINQLFTNQTKTKCSFLSEYKYPVKFREKTRLGRFFNITNWKEEVHTSNEEYIMVTTENLKNDEIINYCLYIQKGMIEPYIIFYNKQNIFYISNDVIDIISSSKEMISNIK
ncbi:phage tail protein [Mammaliicoccus sciuri]|uniref:phage tail protein n=1 Tax=Mammaliicoccus sciuri TaxID=1296 RepID=UPI0021D3C80F|nr:phage tail protein [Mammaliicoccus sciuri]UXU83909.1 phage tail protein [Mammaliicoccus sciuri]UXU93756.1 phage tail protein [Mammaliicoccus sciuri]UXV15704.1 phage tail protein [Mammaliicoccus sciuri]UXV23966.1 phage tail protein [Mammaliicoccus sciuri]UXV26747.1 phage tail protein [Mammaliicoccus sciuri]